MITRILMVFGIVALLGACETMQEGEDWYCGELPKDSWCTGQENPSVFDE